MTDHLTLSALNVGPKDLMVMRSLLNLAGGRDSRQTWGISEEAGGDVILVDIDTADGEAVWKELTQRGQPAISFSRRKDFQARFLLGKPLRSREFLTLLTRLANGDFEFETESRDEILSASVDTSSATGSVESIWKPLAVGEKAGFFTLAEHLRRQTWSKPVVITHGAWPLLLIDPGSGAWFFDGSITDMEPPMFAEPMPASAGVAVSSADLVERVQGHRQRPLSELKWFAGLAQSRGHLHPDLIGEIEFMLTQVPAQAMKTEALHQLAQILIRGPITLEALSEESDQPPENLMAFLNACYTSGKLLVNRTVTAQVVSF
ncbi:MAG: hypothetical protein ACNA7J_08600 [Wenzhouxiangella sp.]